MAVIVVVGAGTVRPGAVAVISVVETARATVGVVFH